jgi:ATP-dependent RNA helicase RhlE
MPFSKFGLNPKLLQAVKDLGFETPTAIQSMAIPPQMEGRDVLAAAVTGSGKTAAFLLPILHSLMDKPRGKTRALVLAPTRELAAQIADHLKELAAHTHLKGAAVYGGVGMQPQVKAFQRGVDVIVATPGRLLDHFQYPYAKLDSLEFLVIDEADRMLDMGFLPDVKRIMKALPSSLRTLLFSATLPQPIVELAGEMLKDPIRLNVERKAAPAVGITHSAYPVSQELKSHLLLELLKRPEARSVLAFTRTKHRANRLADFLEKQGVSCARIHGNRSQTQRTEALAGFKAGKFRILVATDIAARGIDVEALGLVVNFDVPNIAEDYIHRVGRTARADATGHAHTLVSPQEESDLRTIEAHVGKRIQRHKVDGFDYTHKPQERLEIPIAERIAAIRARKSAERARAKAKLEGRASRPPAEGAVRTPHAATAKKTNASRGNGTAKPDAARPRTADPRSKPHHDSSPRPRTAATEAVDRSHRGQGANGNRKPEDTHHRGQQPRNQGQRPSRNSSQGQAIQGSRPAHSSFIRSSLRPDWQQAGTKADTSGVREDVHRSHKGEVSGQSQWGKAWRDRSGSPQPQADRQE